MSSVRYFTRLFAVAGCLLCIAPPARAAYTLRVTPEAFTMDAGTSQRLAIELVADANAPAINLYGFDVRLDLKIAPAGVRFAAVEMPLTGYVFQDNSFDYRAGPINTTTGGAGAFPALAVGVSDSPNDPFPMTIAGGPAGSVWQLGVVTLTAVADTPGGVVSVLFDGKYTLLDSGQSDPAGNPIGYSVGLVGVKLQVNEGSPVAAPAPAGVLLGLIGAGCLGGCGWVRRARRPLPGGGKWPPWLS